MWIKPLERIHPQNSSWIYKGTINQHVKRYEYAATEGVGKKVLDIACGTGYGCSILANVAESVVGIDISSDVVEIAKKEFPDKKIIFQQGDASRIEFPDNTFDTITSFETIEHLPKDKVDKYLSELFRVLKPGGLIYISSPDSEGFSLGEQSSNHFHVQEFTSQNFYNLISNYFIVYKVLAQETASVKVVRFIQWIARHTNSLATQKAWRAYKTLFNCTGNLSNFELKNTQLVPYIIILKAKKI